MAMRPSCRSTTSRRTTKSWESLPHFQRILEEASRRQLMVQMGYMYRYNPAVVLLSQHLRDGWLGNVFEVHAVMSKVVAPEERRRLAFYPGGMMFELGCHLLDIVIKILGPPSDVTGFAKHAARTDDSLVDNMLAVLSYPRALATVKSSGLEFQGGDRRHLVACGTAGTCHIQPLDNPSVRLTLAAARGDFRAGTHEIAMPRHVRYIDDAVDMAKVIRGEKRPTSPTNMTWRFNAPCSKPAVYRSRPDLSHRSRSPLRRLAVIDAGAGKT